MSKLADEIAQTAAASPLRGVDLDLSHTLSKTVQVTGIDGRPRIVTTIDVGCTRMEFWQALARGSAPTSDLLSDAVAAAARPNNVGQRRRSTACHVYVEFAPLSEDGEHAPMWVRVVSVRWEREEAADDADLKTMFSRLKSDAIGVVARKIANSPFRVVTFYVGPDAAGTKQIRRACRDVGLLVSVLGRSHALVRSMWECVAEAVFDAYGARREPLRVCTNMAESTWIRIIVETPHAVLVPVTESDSHEQREARKRAKEDEQNKS
jgi:hypothetical protein